MRRFIPFLKSPAVVPVIRLQGLIAAGRPGGALNDAALAPLLERAFTRGKPAAVALAINCPGGSPVQSSLIAARIRRLAAETDVPVHAFVEDLAASGGYWLACAADRIWVDESSLVGSIGVISSGFGFAEAMARLGVERRVQTAGRSKSWNDPFLPQKPEDVARLRAILEPLHQTFIAQVRARRGDRLDATADLFNADVWLGAQAVRLGLADGVAHLVPKMKELFGDKVRLVPLGQRRSLAQRLGLQLADATALAVEERLAGARYGL
ncbi:MAG: S49 family peptidase [Rhodobacterales bacterium]|nr:S49 family peptidase [Rhodobacterales bacterium]